MCAFILVSKVLLTRKQTLSLILGRLKVFFRHVDCYAVHLWVGWLFSIATDCILNTIQLFPNLCKSLRTINKNSPNKI